jgi:hypothetical protein
VIIGMALELLVRNGVMRRALGMILGLALLSSVGWAAESVPSMTLKGPDGASPAALEEAGRALLARCEVCGFKGVQTVVRDGSVVLTAPDGFTPEMQFSIAALGYFSAKSVELRVQKTLSDGNTPLSLDAVRALEAPPDSTWLPYQPLRPNERRPFHDAVRANWRACQVAREPVIPLSVPVPFVLGGRPGAGSLHAYYELTDDRLRVLGDLSLERKPYFALSVDGHVLVYGHVFSRDVAAKLNDKDRLGAPIAFSNPVLYFRLCEGYNKEVEAIVRVALPFALTVTEPAPR